jgi:hypothetical protein
MKTAKKRARPSILTIVKAIRKTQLAHGRRIDAIEVAMLNSHMLGRLIHGAIEELQGPIAEAAKQRETIGTMARHAERLLREKETVMSVLTVDELQRRLKTVDEFQAAPVGAPYAGCLAHDQVFAGSKPMSIEGQIYVGSAGDIGHSPPIWCKQHLCYCTDAETRLHMHYAAGPRNAALDAFCASLTLPASRERIPAGGTYVIDEHVFHDSKPLMNPATARPSASAYVADNGHSRIPTLRPYTTRPAYELCGFKQTHRAGVKCQICEWPG